VTHWRGKFEWVNFFASRGSATMKVIQFTAILIMLVFPWAAALSQQQNSTVAIETEATSDTTNANIESDE
jgi:hypothetical protein